MGVVGLYRVGILISTLTLMALLLPGSKPSYAYEAEVGNRAADFTGFDIVNRETIRLEDFLGRWVFVEFWATWCGPCMRELPNMLEQTRPLVDSGQLKVITINGDPPELRGDLRRAIRKHHITYPVIHDGGIYDPDYGIYPIPAIEWGVTGWPSSFLISPQGLIVANNLKGDKLGPALKVFLSNDPPAVGLRGRAELNSDGSISVYADVLNSGRQDVELRMRAFIEKLLWDEDHIWQDIVDISNSPLSMSATVSFSEFSETVHEFRIEPPDEEWHSCYGGLYLEVPGSEDVGEGENAGVEVYCSFNQILLVDIEYMDGERVITPKPPPDAP